MLKRIVKFTVDAKKRFDNRHLRKYLKQRKDAWYQHRKKPFWVK